VLGDVSGKGVSAAPLVTGYLAADGHVALGNAGHLPPLIVGDSGQRTVQATGVPIGMFCQSEFSATQLSLGRNETLLMYTDGLSEGRNPSGEEYGVRVADVAHRCSACGNPYASRFRSHAERERR
jgi:sigma-B regulation protein RsbU (phosphoserine phosphatase)